MQKNLLSNINLYQHHLDLEKTYAEQFQAFGFSVKSVGWISKLTQHKRFEALLSFVQWQGESILDVGCGLGDLYHYIKFNKINVMYSGCDMNSNFVDAAKTAYPNGAFFTWNLYTEKPLAQKPDYILGSGLFNYRIPNFDQLMYLSTGIHKLLSLANKGVIFNVLHYNRKTDHLNKSQFYYYQEEELIQLLAEVPFYELKKGYLDNDISVCVLK